VTTFSTRKNEFDKLFKTVSYFTYYKQIDGLMDATNMRHRPEQCRLFTDASETSRKAFLLHNKNKLLSIPEEYDPSTKETCITMNGILVKLQEIPVGILW
jgi:hypothetical protein